MGICWIYSSYRFSRQISPPRPHTAGPSLQTAHRRPLDLTARTSMQASTLTTGPFLQTSHRRALTKELRCQALFSHRRHLCIDLTPLLLIVTAGPSLQTSQHRPLPADLRTQALHSHHRLLSTPHTAGPALQTSHRRPLNEGSSISPQSIDYRHHTIGSSLSLQAPHYRPHTTGLSHSAQAPHCRRITLTTDPSV